MSDLTGFLLARIAEDEAGARDGMPEHFATKGGFGPYAFDSEYSEVTMRCGRALAEIDAKRRIVEEFGGYERIYVGRICDDPETAPPEAFVRGHAKDPEHVPVLRLLATVYADHPDYRDEWKP